MESDENKVSVTDLRLGDRFLTPDGVPALVHSPFGTGEGDTKRLLITTDEMPFTHFVDWDGDVEVQLRSREERWS